MDNYKLYTKRHIEYSSIMKLIIIVIMVNSVSLLKPLGIFFSRPVVQKTINIVLISTLIVMCIRFKRALKDSGVLFISSGLLLFYIFIRGFSSEMTMVEYTRSTITYYYIVLSIPVFVLLKTKKIDLNQLIRWIVVISALSFLLRAGISLLDHFKGIKIFREIYMENARENWYRNDFLRINMPAFGLLIVPLIMHCICSCRKKKRKAYIVILGGIILYDLVILQSRMITVYAVSAILLYMLFTKKTSTKKLLLYSIIIIFGVCFFYAGLFDRFIGTFSVSNAKYGGSTQMRTLTLFAALNKIKSSPILGTGIQSNDQISLEHGWTGYLSDIGILASIVVLGIVPVIYDLAFVIRATQAGIESRRISNKAVKNGDALSLSLMISFLITCLSIDWMNPGYIISVPFLFAIVEYIHSVSNDVNNISVDYSFQQQRTVIFH